MTVCGADEFGESVSGAIDTNNNMGKTHIVQDLPLPDFHVVDEATDSDVVVAADNLRLPDDAIEVGDLVRGNVQATCIPTAVARRVRRANHFQSTLGSPLHGFCLHCRF